MNDSYGHDVGDIVLKALASKVSENLRETDVFGRIGGEEFALILTNTAQAAALEVAERLRHDLEQIVVPVSGREPVRFTVSIGLAMHSHGQEHEPEQLDDLLKKADLALYQAKDQGRNRVVKYSA